MKLLYVQHVDWKWIPQRPHFLARQMIDLGHQLDVAYIAGWRSSGNVVVDPALALPASPKKLYGLPRWATPVVRAIDARLLEWQLRPMITKDHDAIWVTHPRVFAGLRQIAGLPPIIYDCMDDAEALEPRGKNYVSVVDQQLFKSSRVVISSSPKLDAKAGSRARQGTCRLVVGNGCRGDYPWPVMRNDGTGVRSHDGADRPADQRPTQALFYGTIGGWLDIEVLLALAEAPGVELRLVGPVRTSLPESLAACCHEPMGHTQLLQFAERWADWLVLPFRKDEFSETVDPVKLHEYVGLGHPILAPELEVLRPADRFLAMYRSPAHAVEITTSPALVRASHQERQEYILSRTWAARALEIDLALAEVFSS
ncbi:MAG: hypothetical protein U0Q19_07005 [Kineosporiaceae bacterium]